MENFEKLHEIIEHQRRIIQDMESKMKDETITLRDQFAMAAMPLAWKHEHHLEKTEGSGQINSYSEDYFFKQVSICAYQIADEMIRKRDDKKD